MTQFYDQLKSRVTSQFINGISRVLQELVKYFTGTTIFTFAIPELLVLSVILDLTLKDLESFMLSFGSSPQYCHKLADIFA